jgi:flagellar biosynthetic protein FlhB
MNHDDAGEKTEQPTPRKLEDAIKRGQIPRSAEVQTVLVLGSVLLVFQFSGAEIWRHMASVFCVVLGHLHDIPLSMNTLHAYFIKGLFVFAACAAPFVIAAMVGGVLAGGLQSRFQTASEVLEFKWERVNPAAGFQRVFSTRNLAPAGLALIKLATVLILSYGAIRTTISDPIFYSTVDVARIAGFMAKAAFSLTLRMVIALAIIAAIDYTYQFWRNKLDLMMSKQEVKEEMRSSEGDPHIKARQRRRRTLKTQRKMLEDVPKADVVVTNPTHLAIALRYDRKTMRAPKIVAKGSRLNAKRIREIAQAHQIPIIENKPLARMMFKYGKVDGEVPAQLYAAVAEILAWVYRVNRYRYYAEQNQTGS